MNQLLQPGPDSQNVPQIERRLHNLQEVSFLDVKVNLGGGYY